MKTPDFMSYDRYKKKKTDKSKNGLMMAVTTFFATLLIFTLVAKSLSPNVDVSIGEDTETDAKETGLGVKKFIDERLKIIQQEDTSGQTTTVYGGKKTPGYDDDSFDRFSKQLEEKVVVPASDGQGDMQTSDAATTARRSAHAVPRPSAKDLSTPFESTRMTKVYVGRYATLEQAKVAQEILQDSGLEITPFVKNVNGSYTLQVGSYSSRAKAEGLASELQRNSFPARVVSE